MTRRLFEPIMRVNPNAESLEGAWYQVGERATAMVVCDSCGATISDAWIGRTCPMCGAHVADPEVQ